MTTEKGGRPATGQVRWRFNPKREDPETGKIVPGFQWFGRVQKADGSRPWAPLDARIPADDEEGARRCAVETAKYFRENPHVDLAPGETLGEWFKRFHRAKEKAGLSSVGDMRGRAKNWILPSIEHKAPRAITSEDIEAIVRRLDRAIVAWYDADGERGEGRLSPSTAANVWGDLAHAFDEMVRAKDSGLRVLAVSPCANVRGPETGADREGPILYSDEIVALVRGKAVDEGDPDVPPYRRRVWALALYEKARRSELAALTAADVDLVHDTIAITKQVDRKAKKKDPKATKKTKTKRPRTVDVEPSVRALVEHLVEHPEGKGGRLLRMPPSEDYAELLRKDLWTVGARDPRLHTSDSTRTKMSGHCLRDTGLTHMAVRGDSPIAIQWAAGHTDFKMTQGYIDRGRVEARRIGPPLPPLPPEVFDGLPLTTPKERAETPTGFGSEFGSIQTAARKLLETIGYSATPTGIEADPLASPELRSIVEKLAAELTSRRNDGAADGSEPSRIQNGSRVAPVTVRGAEPQISGAKVIDLKGRRAGRRAAR